MRMGSRLSRLPRPFMAVACLLFLGLVGLADYKTGTEVSFSVFYLFGVGLATWYVSWKYGIAVSLLSVALWTVGDLMAGEHFTNSFIPIWNAVILLSFYLIVVALIRQVNTLTRGLEVRVKQRTQALTEEIAERERLEKEVLEISEREQRRIGRDLHDSLSQHLTATAMAGRVLEEKLAAKSLPEATDARQIVDLVEDGILQARNLARGIMPVDLDSEGLLEALAELARSITARSQVPCVFTRDDQVQIPNASIATHLYRITQEAISNALRHGKARRIDINLAVHKGATTLTIEDDGVGLTEEWQQSQGLGTRIMAHRAAMIGGQLTIDHNPTGGTLVKCLLTSPSLT